MKKRLWRWVMMSLGWLFVLLAILGVFLPLLPTTPFLLVASACFMRGSPRLAHWLNHHPTFGPVLHNWHQHRAIDRKIKRRAAFFIVLSFSLSIAVVPALWHKAMLLVMLCALLAWFLRLPETDSVAGASENT